MFRGIHAINVDNKGRVAMPARYRQQLQNEAGGQLVLTIDTEHRCLLIYPLPLWEEIEEKINQLSSFDPATRRIQRLLIGHAIEVSLDSHSRILLPPLLREYAAVSKRIMLVGQGNKFELWDEIKWQQSREEWLNQQAIKPDELPEELRAISL